MLSSDVTTNDLANHYRAVRARLMGKSNVVAFPPRKTHQEPTSAKLGPAEVIQIVAPEPEEQPQPKRPLTTLDVQKAVAKFYGITRAELIQHRRIGRFVLPRQVAMYLSHKLMVHKSMPDVGRRFGGRDHTTVLHALRKIERLRQSDAAIALELNRIIAKLGERFDFPDFSFQEQSRCNFEMRSSTVNTGDSGQ